MMIILLSCRKEQDTEHEGISAASGTGIKTNTDKASRFTITDFGSYKLLEVMSPWPGSTDTFRYVLHYGEDPPERWAGKNGVTAIRLPVESLVCFSTSHLPYLEMLGAAEVLTGFPTTDYISSEVFRRQVEQGKIQDLGPSNEINFEVLLELDPDLVVAFSMNNDISMINKIRKSGIPVVFNADFLENHPLGRAEWIRFFAALLDKENLADSIFSGIRTRYNRISHKMNQVTERPDVFTGVVYGDTWFMPGGQNYGSVFFRDAGADYVWGDNLSKEILQLSFESVYEKAGKAEFWVGVATYNSLEAIKQADVRYAGFRAWQLGNVYNYTARQSETGGNEYFEMGYARPDIILSDLASIFHPELMSGHELYFYKKLP